MHNLVNVISGDPWLHSCGGNIQYLTSQSTNFSHPFLLLLVQYLDFVPSHKRALAFGNAIIPIIGVLYGLRNVSTF
jgi:hypothetical protein